MAVGKLQCLQHFFIYSDLRFIHPLLGGICIQFVFSLADDVLDLMLCLVLVILQIQTYNIERRVCLDHIRSHLTVVQCSQNFHDFIRICGGGSHLLSVSLLCLRYIGVKSSGQCGVVFIDSAGRLVKVRFRILFHGIKDLLCVRLLLLDLLVREICGGNAHIGERGLLRLFF